MSSDFVEFGFDDNDESFKKAASRFKAKEGETYRLSFVWWPTEGQEGQEGPDLNAKTCRFIGAKRVYIQGVGYVLANNAEISRLASRPPKPAIATIVAKWPTTKKGSLDKEAFMRGEVEVMPWVFSQDRYEVLKRRHEEFPLGSHDITASCTDTKFQKLDLSPCRESLYAKVLSEPKLKAIGAFIQGEISRIEESINNEVARSLTPAQVREVLGGESSSPVEASASADVEGLLDDLGI